MSNYTEKPLEQQQQQPAVYYHPPPLSIQPPATGYHPTGQSVYPGAAAVPQGEFWDPNQPRPNDILPLHPAIIQQRQIAATLPPCPKGGYHELRSHHALGCNGGTFLSVAFFPLVCCFCVKNETVCIKCQEKFDIDLPRVH